MVELARLHQRAGRKDLHRQLIAQAAAYLRKHGEFDLAEWAETH